LPAGADRNLAIRCPGEGHPGEPGAPPGDLLVGIHVRRHPIFERQGHDLHCELPISFSQAALGGEVEVPLLDGSRTTVRLKRGTQYGNHERLRGKGMPLLRGGGRTGDLIVHLKVVTPSRLTKRQEELLRELGEIEGANLQPEQKSFWDRVKDLFSGPAAAGGESQANSPK